MPRIEFTDNYEDLSTESGYQFKFCCERCGNGYMSTWKASKAAWPPGLLRGAGSMFGGFLGSASSGADQHPGPGAGPRPRRGAARGRRRDPPAVHPVQALRAVGVRGGLLEQGTRPLRGLRAHGAARGGSLQAQITIDQAGEKLREQDLTEGLDLKAPAVLICPSCGVENEGGKFCAECGGSLLPKTECPKCGTKFKAGSKFCPECGLKT